LGFQGVGQQQYESRIKSGDGGLVFEVGRRHPHEVFHPDLG